MTEDTLAEVQAIAEARRQPGIASPDWLRVADVLEQRAADPTLPPDIRAMDREAAAQIRQLHGGRA